MDTVPYAVWAARGEKNLLIEPVSFFYIYFYLPRIFLPYTLLKPIT
jgi:hypothetical protein